MNRVVITPENPKSAEGKMTGFAPIDLFWVALRNGELLRALIQRDIEMRYRGSVLGAIWLVAVPLVMLAAYTFVFAVVMKARFGQNGSLGESSLAIYAGLIVFNLFSEQVGRAPGLISENAVFVKRVVFPLRVMAWMSLATAFCGAGVSLAVLLCFHVILVGLPPLTALLAPLALVPVCLLSLGMSWLLSSAGVFIRDVKHAAGMLTTLLMFVTPVFYPLTSVPDRFRAILYINPLSYSVETFRNLLVEGVMPSLAGWSMYLAGCLAFASSGYAVFTRLQRRFSDVV